MATAQTYRRQFKKTFEIVDKVASEYYDLLDKEKIEENNERIKWYEELIENLKEENKKIESHTRCLKDTLKDGNGIDKDYCKWLLDNQD